MSQDISSTPLPPKGAKLRLPPKSSLTYHEKHAQIRRHLKDDGAKATMSVQMKSQVRSVHAEQARVGTAH